jgi:hypothetical protein
MWARNGAAVLNTVSVNKALSCAVGQGGRHLSADVRWSAHFCRKNRSAFGNLVADLLGATKNLIIICACGCNNQPCLPEMADGLL